MNITSHTHVAPGYEVEVGANPYDGVPWLTIRSPDYSAIQFAFREAIGLEALRDVIDAYLRDGERHSATIRATEAA